MKTPVWNKRIDAVVTRHYRDNDQTTVYIYWADGGRTEGKPNSEHIKALVARAVSQGVKPTIEQW
jgi:hypothetical protein